MDTCDSWMGDKTIPDSAQPRLESFYPPFVTGIDLPHQGIVDSYNLRHGTANWHGTIRMRAVHSLVWPWLGWVDVPECDWGDIRRRRAIHISSWLCIHKSSWPHYHNYWFQYDAVVTTRYTSWIAPALLLMMRRVAGHPRSSKMREQEIIRSLASLLRDTGREIVTHWPLGDLNKILDK